MAIRNETGECHLSNHSHDCEEHGQWEFNNMMVVENENGVSERVGLGKVMRKAVLDLYCNLGWKEVLLG